MRLRLEELRVDNDIKQETLAKLLNVRQATYSRYETGKLKIPVEALIELAKFYNTIIDYVTGVIDQKITYDLLKSLLQNCSD